MLKNHNGLHTLEGYGHMLLIIRNNHLGNQRRSLMMGYSGFSPSSKKGVEMIMKTTISLYGKGNKVIFGCAFDV
jgi:hypothetical protein